MTHILLIYDGDAADGLEELSAFLQFIKSCSYEVEENGIKTFYDAIPRLLIPINVRISEKVKDRFIEDLKYFESGRIMSIKSIFKNFVMKKIINKLGLKILDTEKVRATKTKKDLHYSIKNVHLSILGELPDTRRSQDGNESL